MTEINNKIPIKIKIGGQEIDVNLVERCDDNCLGEYISESCKLNTF